MTKSYKKKKQASLHAVRRNMRLTPKKPGLNLRSRGRRTPRKVGKSPRKVIGSAGRARRLRGGADLDECPICFEKFNTSTCLQLPCSHIAHKTCLERIMIPRLCPICRNPFNILNAVIVNPPEFTRDIKEAQKEMEVRANAASKAAREKQGAGAGSEKWNEIVRKQQIQNQAILERQEQQQTQRHQEYEAEAQRIQQQQAQRIQQQQAREIEQQQAREIERHEQLRWDAAETERQRRRQIREQQRQTQIQQLQIQIQQQEQIRRDAAARQQQQLDNLQRRSDAPNEAALLAELVATRQQTNADNDDYLERWRQYENEEEEYNDAARNNRADPMLVDERYHAMQLAKNAATAAQTRSFGNLTIEYDALRAATQAYPGSTAIREHAENVGAANRVFIQENVQQRAQARERAAAHERAQARERA